MGPSRSKFARRQPLLQESAAQRPVNQSSSWLGELESRRKAWDDIREEVGRSLGEPVGRPKLLRDGSWEFGHARNLPTAWRRPDLGSASTAG